MHQCIHKIPRVLNLDPQIILVPLLLEISRLWTHRNSDVRIEGQFIRIVIAGFSVSDEAVEMDDVFELRVGVQEEGGVVCVWESEGAEFLEVGDQIVYAI